MKKLLISFLSLFSLAVNAADFVVNGIAYNAISLSDLTCEVTSNSTPYTGDIVIPETVSYQNRTFTVIGIGSESFSECGDITSLILPNTLTYIGSKAFINCSKLTRLSIPGSVTSIGSVAMARSGIKALRLEDGNTTLKIEKYNNGAYSYSSFVYNNIDTLYLGRNLTGGDTEKGFFKTDTYSSYRNTLSEITIGHCVTYIPSHVFWCSKAKKIVIPSSVTKIYDDAFEDCYYEELIFEDGDTPIELGIHNYYNNYNQSQQSEYCVMHNYNLKNLYIGRDIKLAQAGSHGSNNYFYIHGFYNISNLKNVTIGESVTYLPAHLLRDCNGIEKIVLPQKLSNLNNALVGCTGIMDITCQSSIPPSVTSSSFTNNQYLNARVKVAEDAYDTYKANEVWGQFWGLTKAGSSDMETKQCAKPVISYSNKKFSFSCETEGAEFHSSISCSDAKSFTGEELDLEAIYDICVYATCYGYSQSEVTKAKLYWVDGTIDATDVQSVNSNARGILIQSNNGVLSISGLETNEHVTLYDTSGKMIGSAKAFMGEANFSINNANKIIIVKIGTESIKLVM